MKEQAPFEPGDLVMTKTLFGRKTAIVNRVWKTCSGWEMLVDDFWWRHAEDRMIRWCKVVSANKWFKI